MKETEEIGGKPRGKSMVVQNIQASREIKEDKDLEKAIG